MPSLIAHPTGSSNPASCYAKATKPAHRAAAEAAIKIARETNDDEYLRLSQEALNLAR